MKCIRLRNNQGETIRRKLRILNLLTRFKHSIPFFMISIASKTTNMLINNVLNGVLR